MGIHLSLQVDKDLKSFGYPFVEYLILNFQIWLFIF